MADLLIVRRQHNAIVTHTSDKGRIWFDAEVIGGIEDESVVIPDDCVEDFIKEAEQAGLDVAVR
jgi:hypothetical protein